MDTPCEHSANDESGQQIAAQIGHDSLRAGVGYHRFRGTTDHVQRHKDQRKPDHDPANLARIAAFAAQEHCDPDYEQQRDQQGLAHHQELRHHS